MMGHHGLRVLLRLAEEALAENQRRRQGAEIAPRPDRERLDEELRRLYAQGELDRSTFLELRLLAERGELNRADLEEARRQAAEVRALESPEARAAGEAMSRLRRHAKALEKAKQDSEATASHLEEQVAELEMQASRDEQEARNVVLADEARARSILQHRQLLLEQVERLRGSVARLREDIDRMEDLERQLRLQEQELEAERARARMAALQQQIRGSDRQSRDR